MDGQPHTDAGWLTRGQSPLMAGRITWWHRCPRLARAAIRWASLAAIAGTAYGYALAPDATMATARGLLLV
ncbi:hypothetical protein, partial [Klebsiella pneumoniae]|uniref:hypothetical protein n=1 Tax=Klebsiella pneumoniae TaxID=573 RepID=UPI001E59B414